MMLSHYPIRLDHTVRYITEPLLRNGYFGQGPNPYDVWQPFEHDFSNNSGHNAV